MPSFFEDCEGLLDGVEVWAVARKRQEDVAVSLQQFPGFWLVVEGRVIHHDHAVGAEFRQQSLFHPGKHGVVGATALEKHRCEVQYTLRSPFELFVEEGKCKDWLRELDSNQRPRD